MFGISVVKPKKLNLLDIFSVSLDNVTVYFIIIVYFKQEVIFEVGNI